MPTLFLKAILKNSAYIFCANAGRLSSFNKNCPFLKTLGKPQPLLIYSQIQNSPVTVLRNEEKV